ncbi:uncharacterized [Tachysurus ichikawai]
MERRAGLKRAESRFTSVRPAHFLKTHSSPRCRSACQASSRTAIVNNIDFYSAVKMDVTDCVISFSARRALSIRDGCASVDLNVVKCRALPHLTPLACGDAWCSDAKPCQLCQVVKVRGLTQVKDGSQRAGLRTSLPCSMPRIPNARLHYERKRGYSANQMIELGPERVREKEQQHFH